MTEQEYIAKLMTILHSENTENISETQKLLDVLFTIKPVRLDWYTAKAKALWKSGQPIGEAVDILADKAYFLFPYQGLKNMHKLYTEIIGSYQDLPDVQRHKLLFMGICNELTKEDNAWIKDMGRNFRQVKSDFLQNPDSEHAANQLLEYYFIFHNTILFYILHEYMMRSNIPVYAERGWFLNFINHGFLLENLAEEASTPFVIFEDENSDGLDEKVTVYLLEKLNKKIYYIKAPIVFQIEHKIEIEETAAVSMENMESIQNLNTIYPAEMIFDGENLGDNREYILAHLIKNELKDQFAVILTSGLLMNNLCIQPVLKKNLERLYNFSSPVLENQMVFGWGGDYLAYISQIHDIEAEKLLYTPPEVSYSIIVPARNSAHTLRYTLMSCLEQRYTGDYEIVLSDNSTPGNTEVYQLYRELDDPRIKYYKTPREYNLSRSFEFAFLHARGEFLLSLGSDDALLPWALEILDDLQKVYPNEDVIQWERGFYAWPGFNGGQQNQFVIPRKYKKGELHPKYIAQQYYFSLIFNNSDQMYLLPNLYLNSGCKRNYLKKILGKTGRLFDGICQDIYMGVVNISINEKILNIRYPLVIAGMAGGSMGAKANTLYALNEEEKEFLNDLKKTANIGGYCASPYERLMPEVTTDKSSLYNCILRMIARGVIAESDLEQIDFRKWFVDVFSQMDIRDPLFDKKIHYFQYTASLHGEEFLNWFNDTIYHNALKPRFIDEEKLAKLHERKCYTEDINQFGGQTLDASKYSVKNVYDASKLFEKLCIL